MQKKLRELYYHFKNKNDIEELPEVAESMAIIMELYKTHILEHKPFDEEKGWDRLNDLLSNLASINELQGFIYGFGYAMQIASEYKALK